jgi:hypothetical protein
MTLFHINILIYGKLRYTAIPYICFFGISLFSLLYMMPLQNTLMVYRHLGGPIMPKSSIYFSKRYEFIIKRFKEICKREGLSVSRKLLELMRDYVVVHEEGNPQTTLTRLLTPLKSPSLPILESGRSQFPMERKIQNVEWLEEIIKRNPGRSLHKIASAFSVAAGLRKVTVLQYIRDLREAGKVIERYGKLYHRDSLQAEAQREAGNP